MRILSLVVLLFITAAATASPAEYRLPHIEGFNKAFGATVAAGVSGQIAIPAATQMAHAYGAALDITRCDEEVLAARLYMARLLETTEGYLKANTRKGAFQRAVAGRVPGTLGEEARLTPGFAVSCKDGSVRNRDGLVVWRP